MIYELSDDLKEIKSVAFLDTGDLGPLLDQYGNLDEDLRTELPLRRIWTVALPDEGE